MRSFLRAGGRRRRRAWRRQSPRRDREARPIGYWPPLNSIGWLRESRQRDETSAAHRARRCRLRAARRSRACNEWASHGLLRVRTAAGKPVTKRLGWARRLVELRPNSAAARWQAAVGAAEAGLLDESGQHVRHGLAWLPQLTELTAWPVFRLRFFAAHVAWLRARPHEAVSVLDAIVRDLSALPQDAVGLLGMQVANAYETLGRFQQSEEAANTLAAAFTRRFALSGIAASRQDHELLRSVIRREFGSVDEPTPVVSLLVDAGLVAEARQALATLRSRTPGPPQPYTSLVAGQIALADGNWDEAVDHLRLVMQPQTLRVSPHQWCALPGSWRMPMPPAATALLRSMCSKTRARATGIRARSRYSGVMRGCRAGSAWRSYTASQDAERVEAELRTLLAAADDDHPIRRRLKWGGRARYRRVEYATSRAGGEPRREEGRRRRPPR
jgi:hypothetical protein